MSTEVTMQKMQNIEVYTLLSTVEKYLSEQCFTPFLHKWEYTGQ